MSESKICEMKKGVIIMEEKAGQENNESWERYEAWLQETTDR